MTITDFERFLCEKNIGYKRVEYAKEADFWRKICMFPGAAKGAEDSVTALEIPCPNGVKHINLQFCNVNGSTVFCDLWFGGYCFELFEYCDDENVMKAVEDNIEKIMSVNLRVIEGYDMKNHKWLFDAAYSDDDDFDMELYERVMRRINAERTLGDKLFHRQRLYEIYDYNKYRNRIKH